MGKNTPRKQEVRSCETRGLGDLAQGMAARIYDSATPEKRRQMRAAERTHEVYAAWNAVCAKTREGQHATGLHYMPESNQLLVYMDGPSWTQEMTMMREIIRARMAALGVNVAGLIFKTSQQGYQSRAQILAQGNGGPVAIPKKLSAPPRPPRLALSRSEEEILRDAVAGIEDDALRRALFSAMETSLECNKARCVLNPSGECDQDHR